MSSTPHRVLNGRVAVVLATSGSEKEQKDAAKVIKLLHKGRHWVLVCLLLRYALPSIFPRTRPGLTAAYCSNVVVNESLRALATAPAP